MLFKHSKQSSWKMCCGQTSIHLAPIRRDWNRQRKESRTEDVTKPIFSIRYFKITTKIVLNIVLCFCKDIPVVTVINHKQSFSLSRKYSNIHEEEYLRTLAFASTAFLHNKIKLHFVTFYRSHCHFHHSIIYSVNKAIKNNIIHSNFSTWQESLNVTSDTGFSGTVF